MEIEAPPSSPALDAARAEATDIATNPQNPRHAGYHRGDPQVSTYLDGIYKKAIPENKPVSFTRGSVSLGPVEPQPGETPEEAADRQRNEVIVAPLKQAWGPTYEARMATVPGTVNTLFEDMGEVYHELGARVREHFGPKGEAATLKYFAELHDIKQGG
jgi:hypothetical protein